MRYPLCLTTVVLTLLLDWGTSSSTPLPTGLPTLNPTALPSIDPTGSPTISPTLVPTRLPTSIPSLHPTSAPTPEPTSLPTKGPTGIPTLSPSKAPSKAPTLDPSGSPTLTPTEVPSRSPTMLPTLSALTVNFPLNGSSFGCEKNLTVSWTSRGVEALDSCPVVDLGLFSKSGSFVTYIAVDFPNIQQTEQYVWSIPMKYCGNGPHKVRVKCSYRYQDFTGVFTISDAPSPIPSPLPTGLPSLNPTLAPTFVPSSLPTLLPTARPAAVPTNVPFPIPTGVPWSDPTPSPTKCFLDACPAGFSCNGKNWTECLPGTYSGLGATECQSCQTGRYTSVGGSANCTKCPAGHACRDPSSEPQVCPPGSYSLGNQKNCSACPAGFSCTSTGNAPVACSGGSYSLSNWAYCVVCPAGSTCTNVAAAPLECPPGTTSNGGAISCTTCTAGKYANSSGQDQCTNCPAGHECPSVQNSPIECREGYYSSRGSEHCTVCIPGTRSSLDRTACLACEAGYECGDPTAGPKRCADGFYSLNGSNTRCTLCPRGHFCASSSGVPQSCPSGYFSPFGSTNCTACPAGYECPNPTIGPLACSAGQYSYKSSCWECDSGKECPSPDVAPRDCVPGTYSLAGMTNCTICPRGSYCPSVRAEPFKCPEGYYSLGGAITCTISPKGYFSPSRGAKPLPCGIGTFSRAGALNCTLCPAGYRCETPDALPFMCSPGSFSSAGAQNCTMCPPGYACPHTDRAVMTECERGSYSRGGASSCTSCDVGYACPRTDLAVKYKCSPGTYSRGSAYNCTECPAGWECPSTDGTSMSQCSMGYFATVRSTACTRCPKGAYCPYTDRAVIIDCSPGTFSLGGQTSCTSCSAGDYCPYIDTDDEIPCASGTYSVGSQDACTECPAGFSCPSTNTDALKLCGTGYYSLLGYSDCEICPAGSFCPHSAIGPLPCPYGTYSPPGATNCTICPAGYECPTASSDPAMCGVGYFTTGGATTCKACTPGFRCPSGSRMSTPPGSECPVGAYCNPAYTIQYCDAGFYGNVTAGRSHDDACTRCEPGYYCGQSGTTYKTMTICEPGYYCSPGSVAGTPCPAGTYNDQYGKTILSSCKLCAPGYYCVEASSALATVCPSGYYCPAGTMAYDAYPCPAGTYSDKRTGLYTSSQCYNCTAGSYCREGSVDPVACLAGTYNARSGMHSSISCTPCEAGWACPSNGMFRMTTRCAAGHACPAGTEYATENPCPAGTYSDARNLTKVDECLPCPASKACPIGSTSSTWSDCAQGHYCPEGIGSPTAYECPAGKYSNRTNLGSDAECTDCPRGYFCDGGKTTPDGSCEAGYYCPLGSESPTQEPCPAGTYSSRINNYIEAQCADCPPGSYCPTASTDPIECPAGTYSSVNNTEESGPGSAGVACVSCPSGSYCKAGAVVPIACGVGSYSPDSASSCSDCEAGHYCGSNTTAENDMYTLGGRWDDASDAAGRCFNGTLCPKGMNRAPDLYRDACPAGFFCPTATSFAESCPAGTYQPHSGQDEEADCYPTPAGYYSMEGSENFTGRCAPGHYCPVKSTSPTQVPCPERFYRARYGGESVDGCALCPSGGYCRSGATAPLVCPKGFYCVTGVSEPEPCPLGTYGNSTGLRRIEACTPCEAGKYCDGLGLTAPRGPCDPGYYCLEGSYTSAPNAPGSPLVDDPTVIGGLCWAGHYCPLGSAAPIACPASTFNNITGTTSLNDCGLCLPGYYCAGSGNTMPTGKCYQGYYCEAGSSSPAQSITPPGYFSPAGASQPSPCPPGTWQPSEGQSDCLICHAGFVCQNMSTIKMSACPRGRYCPNGTDVPQQCPLGTFSDQRYLGRRSECNDCTAGSYCGTNGLVAPTGLCNAGYYCSGADIIANPNLCPEGHYCLEGTAVATPCPAGTFYPNKGHKGDSKYLNRTTFCTLCTGGKACNSTGLTAPDTKCAPGYFCGVGAWSATPYCEDVGESCDYGPCPAGSYCTAGSIEPKECAPGFFQDSAGQDTCNDCIAGTYQDSPGSKECKPCPSGYYSTGGAINCSACEPGTYQISSGQDTCNNCTAGTYQDNPGSMGCKLCPSGFYSEGVATSCKPCEPGTYQTEADYGRASCDTCPAGFYCSIAGTTIPENCPAGHYCPAGTAISTQYPCENGTFSNKTMLVAASDCEPCLPGMYCDRRGLTSPVEKCSAGFYCGGGSATRNPDQDKLYSGESCVDATNASMNGMCPPGHYCPTGSSAPHRCPIGTYTAASGLESRSECSSCIAGYVCGKEALVQPTELCPKGFYCPNGTSEATKLCPPGSFCEEGSASPESCTTGYYQTDEGQSSCVPCPQGFVCKVGTGTTSSIEPIECPRGHFCPPATSIAKQFPCPNGTFNNKTMLVDVSQCQICLSGMYCDRPGLEVPRGFCEAGYYCGGGSTTATPDRNQPYQGETCVDQTNATGNGVCPPGHFCPEGSSSPSLCEPGTYTPKGFDGTGLQNSSQCRTCKAGYYCPTYGTIEIIPCTEGFYCPMGTVTPSLLCASGHYCEEGSIDQISCDPGTFQKASGQADCDQCPAGFWCSMGNFSQVSPKPCPRGYYCPPGTSLATQYPCPNGTFSNQTHLVGVDQCESCPPGMFCDRPALPIPVGYCDAGYYCGGGSNSRTPDRDRVYKGDTCVDQTNATMNGICPPGHYCPSGTYAPKGCGIGTFAVGPGLHNASQCRECRPGYVCDRKGLSILNHYVCPGGFFCERGTTVAIDVCPTGHSCPEGSTTASPCHPGYYQNETGTSACLTCPAGAVCPGTASVHPQSCAVGTYNSYAGRDNVDDCLPCPHGYFCAVRGISDYKEYPCPVGGYCADKSLEVSWCPRGTYQNRSRMGALTSCRSCPAGFYCGEGEVHPKYCADPQNRAGYYCPEGSGNMTICDAGHFCPPGSKSTKPCPSSYYCPQGSIYPKLCFNGTYCPRTSHIYKFCPLGFHGSASNTNNSFATVGEACSKCSPGKYRSIADSFTCLDCEPGYVCLGATPAQYPSDESSEKGYICPAGNYCPAGSSKEIPCPVGHFNPDVGASNISSCKPCSSGAYQDSVGSAGCKTCSSSSESLGPAATQCRCIGANRAFQASDGYCICEPGFEWYDSNFIKQDGDGEKDCQPIVYPRCSTKEVRDQRGACIDEGDCSAQCGNDGGKFLTTLGICECNNMPMLEEVCDSNCRTTSSYLLTISSDEISACDSTRNCSSIFTSDISGFHGALSCPYGDCTTHSIDITSGGFEGIYGLGPVISAETRRRRRQRRRQLDQNDIPPTISNPVVCISIGDSVIFDVDNENYPVYLKDSLLNTNMEFDYGHFRNLAASAASSSTITSFGFTFEEAGIYAFSSSSSRSFMLVAVMSEGNECAAEDGATFVPMSEQNSKLMSAKMDTEQIIIDPDWSVIIGLLGGLLILIGSFIALVHQFRREEWRVISRGNPAYREKTRRSNLGALAPRQSVLKENRKSAKVAPGAGENAAIEDPEGGKNDEGDDNFQEFEVNEGSPSVDELLKQLQRHHDAVEQKFLGQSDLIGNLKKALQGEADDLRRILNSISVQKAGDGLAGSEERNALLSLKQAMGARRVHERAEQQLENKLLENVKRLQEIIDRGPDVVGQEIIAEIARDGYVDDPPPEESTILTEIIEELNSLSMLVNTQLLPNLEKETRRMNISKSVWENSCAISSFDTSISASVAAVDEATDTFDQSSERFAHLFRRLADRIPTFVKDLLHQQARLLQALKIAYEMRSTPGKADAKLKSRPKIVGMLEQLKDALLAVAGEGQSISSRLHEERKHSEDRRVELDGTLNNALQEAEAAATTAKSHLHGENNTDLINEIRNVLSQLNSSSNGAAAMNNMAVHSTSEPAGANALSNIEDIQKAVMDTAQTDIEDEQQNVLDQAKMEASHRLEDIEGSDREQEEVLKAMEEEQKQLAAALESLAKTNLKGLAIQQKAETLILEEGIEKVEEDEQEEEEILRRQRKERKDLEERQKEEERRVLSAIDKELGDIEEDTDFEETIDQGGPLSPQQLRELLQKEQQNKRKRLEKQIDSLNSDERKEILAALDDEEVEAKKRIEAAIADGVEHDTIVRVEAEAARNRTKDAAALASVHRRILDERLKNRRRKVEDETKELSKAEQNKQMRALEKEEETALSKLEAQIASGKVNLDEILNEENYSNNARANELKMLANTHRELLKNRLKAKRKRAEARVKHLNKADKAVILRAIDEESAEATHILDEQLNGGSREELCRPLAEIAEEDGKQRAALLRNLLADAAREKVEAETSGATLQQLAELELQQRQKRENALEVLTEKLEKRRREPGPSTDDFDPHALVELQQSAIESLNRSLNSEAKQRRELLKQRLAQRKRNATYDKNVLGVSVDIEAVEAECRNEEALLEKSLQQKKMLVIQEELERQAISVDLCVDLKDEIARLKAKHDEDQAKIRDNAAEQIAEAHDAFDQERRKRRDLLEKELSSQQVSEDEIEAALEHVDADSAATLAGVRVAVEQGIEASLLESKEHHMKVEGMVPDAKRLAKELMDQHESKLGALREASNAEKRRQVARLKQRLARDRAKKRAELEAGITKDGAKESAEDMDRVEDELEELEKLGEAEIRKIEQSLDKEAQVTALVWQAQHEKEMAGLKNSAKVVDDLESKHAKNVAELKAKGDAMALKEENRKHDVELQVAKKAAIEANSLVMEALEQTRALQQQLSDATARLEAKFDAQSHDGSTDFTELAEAEKDQRSKATKMITDEQVREITKSAKAQKEIHISFKESIERFQRDYAALQQSIGATRDEKRANLEERLRKRRKKTLSNIKDSEEAEKVRARLKEQEEVERAEMESSLAEEEALLAMQMREKRSNDIGAELMQKIEDASKLEMEAKERKEIAEAKLTGHLKRIEDASDSAENDDELRKERDRLEIEAKKAAEAATEAAAHRRAIDAAQRLQDEANESEARAYQTVLDEKARAMQARHDKDEAVLKAARTATDKSQKQKLKERLAAKKMAQEKKIAAARKAELDDMKKRHESEINTIQSRLERSYEAVAPQDMSWKEAVSAIMVNRPVHSPGVSNEEEITWEKSIVETVMHENIAPLDRFDLVVEFVVHNRHTRETSDLLAQQYRKTAMAVSKALTAVFNEKASARKAIVNDTARFPGDEEERLQKLKDIDIEFAAKQKEAEKDAMATSDSAHLEQQAELHERHLNERMAILQELAPKETLKKLHIISVEEQAAHIEAFRDKVAQEKAAKIAEIESSRVAAEALLQAKMAEDLRKFEVRQQEEVEAKQAELERERVRLEKERKDAMKNIQNEEDGKVHKALVDKLRRESAAVEKDLRNVQKDAKSRLKKQLEARRRKKQKELEEKMKSNAVEQEAQITLLEQQSVIAEQALEKKFEAQNQLAKAVEKLNLEEGSSPAERKQAREERLGPRVADRLPGYSLRKAAEVTESTARVPSAIDTISIGPGDMSILQERLERIEKIMESLQKGMNSSGIRQEVTSIADNENDASNYDDLDLANVTSRNQEAPIGVLDRIKQYADAAHSDELGKYISRFKRQAEGVSLAE